VAAVARAVSGDGVVERRFVGPDIGSDHRSVIVDLRIRPTAD
jgi:endonuclease/exonuclease/phosphatase (EEP) superfamily protein YafD